jgi:hypothetical protein
VEGDILVQVAGGAAQYLWWMVVVGVLSSADESVSVVGGDSGGDRRVCQCFRRVVGSVSNSAGWPESCNFLLVLLVRSGMRVEGCRDRVGSVGEESCWCQNKSGRMPGLAAYTRLRFSEGQGQIIFVAWK